MSWLTGALGDLGVSVAGKLIGGAINSANAAKNAELEAKLQLENWKYMQSNKHQLEVSDLRAAGLNPVLSAGNGSVVSAPSVSADNQGDDGINNAMAARAQIRVADKQAEAQRLSAQADANNAATNLKNAETNEMNARTERLKALSEMRLNENIMGVNNATMSKTFKEIEYIGAEIENRARETQATIDNLKSDEVLKYEQARKVAVDIAYIAEKTTGEKLNQEQIIRDLQDPKKGTEREYYSSLIGKAIYTWRLATSDLTGFLSGSGASVGKSGTRVGMRF